jgi:hypothetical protein
MDNVLTINGLSRSTSLTNEGIMGYHKARH